MVVDIKRHLCDGNKLKWLISAGLAWLEYNQARVNELNVFPVPDGDTGTNMCLTMKKANEAVQDSDENHVGIVSDAVAQGALLGARGNSGVILSQILAGFAQGLRGHEVFDTQVFAYALQKAVDAAYKAVIDPVEGTILTVARESAEAGYAFAQDSYDLIEMLDVMIATGKETLKRTPELLPVLKKAGVVDSGGQGLIFILEGMARHLRDEPVYFNTAQTQNGTSPQGDWEDALVPEDEDGYGYDVQFLIRGIDMDVAKIREDIDAMGWSTLVVGNDHLIKVHVHVHDPGEPISYAIKLGAAIDDVVVENMQLQYQEYVTERQSREHVTDHYATPADQVAIITVASGEGLRYLFSHDMGAACVIAGGQTMNPSTEDFLAAIDQLPNREIILLPNNKNILMAAEQAAHIARDKDVRVIPSRTIPEGINAMIAYSNQRETGRIDGIFADMRDSLTEVVTGEITHATRSIELDSVYARAGQPIGILEGDLVTAGDDLEQVIMDLLTRAEVEDYELITLYYGSEIRAADAEALVAKLQARYSEQEFHAVYGGQPLYPYIISLE